MTATAAAPVTRTRKLANPDTFSMRCDSTVKKKAMYVATKRYADLASVTNLYWEQLIAEYEKAHGPITDEQLAGK